MIWFGIVWLSCCILGGLWFLWFWYLHSKEDLVSDYPYDDEM